MVFLTYNTTPLFKDSVGREAHIYWLWTLKDSVGREAHIYWLWTLKHRLKIPHLLAMDIET
jgi:hypothetical protein